MKRCSTCNRTYTDPNLSFCIEDGTPLTVVSDDESTVVSPRSAETRSENQWNAAPYQPPGSYMPPEVKRRRVWPWVVGIGGAFILGIAAISVAAIVLAPRLFQRPQPTIVVQERNSNQSNNSNQAENSNTAPPANTNANANANVDVDVDTPPPTDHDQVLAQLTDLENEWTVANLNADKRKLNRILADDYVGSNPDGNPLSKAEYLRTVQRITQINRWEFKDLSLVLAGDRATLTGLVTLASSDREVKYDFTDRFVWRDGRWQATSSDVKERQED